jgi:hypothetical protein
MKSDETDNIVRPDFGDPKVTMDRSHGNYCSHQFVVLRQRSRTVYCRSCKEAIDPWDVLAGLAMKWEHCTWEQKKIDELEASIVELKREESNIKGRLRNAHKGAPEPKSVLYFEELMRRVAEVSDWEGQRAVDGWAHGFKWLNAEQEVALKDAMIRARRRIEDTIAKHPKRRRIARVVGKSESEE